MESMYAQPLVEMGVSLTELAIKGTATAVTNKIKAIKDEKNAEKLRNTYDEIVSELLSERDEAVRMGYFCRDTKWDNTFNSIVSLKDSKGK